MTVSKNDLFRRRLPEDDVDIPGVGTVRVRGLSRAEAMHMQSASDLAERDRRLIAQGMVDPMLVIPGLLHETGTKPCSACADAGQWQKASIAGEMEAVSDAIVALSGVGEGARKSDLPSDGSGLVDGVRALPGAEAGHDGGEAPRGNEQ